MADVCIFNKLMTHQNIPGQAQTFSEVSGTLLRLKPIWASEDTKKTTPMKHESLVNDGMITLWETNIAMEYTPEN